MKAARTTFARILAGLCAALFVLTAVIALLLFTVERGAFNPNTYKAALIKERFYDRFPALVAELLTASVNFNPCAQQPRPPQCEGEGEAGPEAGPAPPEEGGPPPFLSALTASHWELILSELIAPDWLKAQTESVLDQLFVFLDSGEGQPDITISTKELRERVGGEPGIRAVLGLVRAQPPCTEGQLADLAAALSAGKMDQILACRPPEEVLAEVRPQIEAQLRDLAKMIPDVAHLNSLGGPGEGEPSPDSPTPPAATPSPEATTAPGATPAPQESAPLNGPGPALRIVRWVMRLSLLLPAFFLLLVTLFGVRSWRGWLGWWGTPFVFTGVIGVVAALVAPPALDWAIATQLRPRLLLFLPPGGLVDVGFAILRDVGLAMATLFGVTLGALGLAGTVMLLARALSRPKTRAEAPAPSPPLAASPMSAERAFVAGPVTPPPQPQIQEGPSLEQSLPAASPAPGRRARVAASWLLALGLAACVAGALLATVILLGPVDSAGPQSNIVKAVLFSSICFVPAIALLAGGLFARLSARRK